MERLKLTQSKFEQSFLALQKALKLFYEIKNRDELEQQIFVTALVKYFELSYEMAWKYLQQVLYQKTSKIIASPKGIFRECFAQNIIDYQLTTQLLGIAEARNATTHDYNEESAQETISRIKEYCGTFEKIMELLSNTTQESQQ